MNPQRPGHLRLVGHSGPTEPATEPGTEPADDTDGSGAPAFEPVEGHRPERPGHAPERAREAAALALVIDAQEAAPPPVGGPSGVRLAVVALIALQLLMVLSQAGRYAALARGGDAYALAALLSAPASLCLYTGALLLALRPGRGRALFIVAAVGLGLSLPAWGISSSWTGPIAFGSMLALAGAWVARAGAPHEADAPAQP